MKQLVRAHNLIFLKIIGLLFCILMILFAVKLYFEFQNFMHNYREVQYSKKILSLSHKDFLKSDLESKKKTDSMHYENVCKQEFIVVNRSQDYLKHDALEHAKKYNLENEVSLLYNAALTPKYQTFIAPKKGQKKIVTRQGFMLWPVEKSKFWLSSRFGPRKKEDGSDGFHYGIDMAAARGTIVRSTGLGKIIEAGLNNGYGKTIVIAHADGVYQTRYAHLDHILIKKNQCVYAGQKIGTVGNTGAVRGKKGGKNAYHLHFEVKRNKKHIDPLKILSP